MLSSLTQFLKLELKDLSSIMQLKTKKWVTTNRNFDAVGIYCMNENISQNTIVLSTLKFLFWNQIQVIASKCLVCISKGN